MKKIPPYLKLGIIPMLFFCVGFLVLVFSLATGRIHAQDEKEKAPPLPTAIIRFTHTVEYEKGKTYFIDEVRIGQNTLWILRNNSLGAVGISATK